MVVQKYVKFIMEKQSKGEDSTILVLLARQKWPLLWICCSIEGCLDYCCQLRFETQR